MHQQKRERIWSSFVEKGKISVRDHVALRPVVCANSAQDLRHVVSVVDVIRYIFHLIPVETPTCHYFAL